MLRGLMLLQSMLGWRKFKTNIAAVLYRHMLGVNMFLHDIMPEVVVRALFAAPQPCVRIHLQFAFESSCPQILCLAQSVQLLLLKHNKLNSKDLTSALCMQEVAVINM